MTIESFTPPTSPESQAESEDVDTNAENGDYVVISEKVLPEKTLTSSPSNSSELSELMYKAGIYIVFLFWELNLKFFNLLILQLMEPFFKRWKRCPDLLSRIFKWVSTEKVLGSWSSIIFATFLFDPPNSTYSNLKVLNNCHSFSTLKDRISALKERISTLKEQWNFLKLE